MFKTDRFNVFAAVDEDRQIVICRIAVWGGGPEDPGGRVWFIENARSVDWAFRFERLRPEPGERKRHARLAQGRGHLPGDAACREIVADFIRFETDRLHLEWGFEDRASDVEIEVDGSVRSGSFGEETEQFPVSLYEF